MSAHVNTALPTLCRDVRNSSSAIVGRLIVVVVLLAVLPKAVCAAEFIPYPGPPPMFSHLPQKKSLIEARGGYLWGINEIRFRDGDNPSIAPGKKD